MILIDYILLISLLVGFYLAWNIGANDAANAMGAPVGGGVLRYRKAIIILIIFVILGAVLEGGAVMKTVGEDIIVPTNGGANPLAQVPIIAIFTLLAAGLWVTIATIFGFPVSTSQSIMGAVMGSGLLISFFGPINGVTAGVEFGKFGKIALSWILSPLGAVLLAGILYKIFSYSLSWIKNIVTINRVFGFFSIAAGCFTAYTLGTNDVSAGVGVLTVVLGGDSIWSPRIVALFGGVALIVGAITYSRRVMQTVGFGITRLDSIMASSAQIGAAVTVWSFNQFGIPVSTSQAIVGGIIGVGLIKGLATVSSGKIGRIALTWVITPMAAALLSFSFSWVFLVAL